MNDDLDFDAPEDAGTEFNLPPPTHGSAGTDERYFELLAAAIRVCADYKPKFGRGRKGGTTLEQFGQLYGSDAFYHWVGLDSPLVYAAHKAAGGMTSIYRQLGIGCQWLFSALLQDTLGLSASQSTWTYDVPASEDTVRTLSLDARIELDHVKDVIARRRVEDWLAKVKVSLRLPIESADRIKGAVFEVRQGYKSKDSKRQNADIANASNAFANLYVPVLLLFSTQIDGDVAARYREARWLLLAGTLSGEATNSTYVFCREVLDYDLASFFERISPRLKHELEDVLRTLLEA